MEVREKRIYNVTALGSAVNVALSGLKFAAGIAGHSSAMIADAVHSLSDLISDAIVLFFVRIANKPQDEDHAYGHGKYETLATVIIGMLLGIVGFGILLDSIGNVVAFFHGVQLGTPNWWALGAAILSVVSKEWLFRRTIRVGKETHSTVVIANAWHHRSDAYTSLATIAGIAGAMFLGPRFRAMDPLAAGCVSVFIIVEAWRVTKPALDELLEKSLSAEELAVIGTLIGEVPGVTGFHNLRTRRVGTQIAVSVHVKMAGDMPLVQAHAIATEVEKTLRSHFGSRTYVSVHMEPN